jgi:hypothetical protein
MSIALDMRLLRSASVVAGGPRGVDNVDDVHAGWCPPRALSE